jgi:cyclopropane fatty-acyl-phospholipid synthase-like methyltransferase
MNNQAHYDAVTDAWTFILGDNLHYGYFAQGGEPLEAATDALVDLMASWAPLGPDTGVIDVGCGIGHPAFRLAERTGCRVTGITISGRGVELGREAALHRGLGDRVTFHQRDALDNGFPDASFDVAWVLESSHLMRDKERLVAETHRVLRPGGTFVLCDLILKRELSLAEVFRLRDDLAALERSFGRAKMETLDYYEQALRAQGFTEVERRDVSRQALPTLDRWKDNVERHRAALGAHLPAEEIDNFARCCEILKDLFTRERLGYGLVKAKKAAAPA